MISMPTPHPHTSSPNFSTLTSCLLLSLHLGHWHPLALLCSTSPFGSTPPPLPSSITSLHIQIFVCRPPALGCFTRPYIMTRPALTLYRFLFPHLPGTSMSPGRFVTLVKGSPVRQEATQEVHLQMLQLQRGKWCLCRRRCLMWAYICNHDVNDTELSGILLLNSIILVYCCCQKNISRKMVQVL